MSSGDEKPRQNPLSGESLRLFGHVPSTCAPPLPEPPATTPAPGPGGVAPVARSRMISMAIASVPATRSKEHTTSVSPSRR